MQDKYGRTITQSGNQYQTGGISITADSSVAALRVFDAMAPAGFTPPAIWSPRDFMKRFTPQELVAIHTAARTDANVAILLSNALADDVHSDSEELSQGLDYLVSQTLLTADRKTAIITP